MKIKKYNINNYEKEKILEAIKYVLTSIPEIIFAYVHGSFVEQQSFRDIDVAVYLKEENLNELVINYEIELEIKLEEKLNYPVDVRVLNFAPLSFQYHTIKSGVLLFEKDEDRRVEFQTKTLDFYFDFAPFRKQYLKEVLGFGDK
ncbi:hypothetical protein Psch_02720 [Pelotomaculum schinkii]|uniref:Polymerase beta nucleotidyltransferase domain-containing protein n=1 Tax=Pelotomaculum schinkii TaxID=78350 RepID=A0A4Y7RAD3_9FIRM|nr:nucleotidyltransferase domain-containing protein [Pelotomaculum schinkii]TEB05679.1 hypothetical protein Psch_02720 [Pelotomaculum schinkii]